MRRNSIAAIATAAAVTIAAGEARAQYWLADRTLTEGRGIRVGNFELHPGVGAEFGFDSNALYESAAQSSLRLRVSGNFGISTLGPQRRQSTEGVPTSLPVQFRANVGVTYSHFFPLAAPTGTNPTDASNLGLTAGLSLNVQPGRTWSFSFSNEFARAVQGTSELNFGSLFVFNRWQNVANLAFTVTPGGGSFEIKGSYTNRLYVFFQDGFSGFNNMANDITMQMRWRFLPKTSLAWSGTVSPSFYFNAPTGMASSGLFGSFPVNTRLGITGLITERLSFQVFGGYGATFFGLGDNAETFVGSAELRYITGPAMSVRFGVLRDINASFIGNYMIRNNVYVNVSHSFGGRFWLSGEAQAGYAQFGYVTDSAGNRSALVTGGAVGTDGRLAGFRVLTQLFGEYRFTDYLGLNATLAFTGNFIDARVGGATGASLGWNKFEGFLGLRVNW